MTCRVADDRAHDFRRCLAAYATGVTVVSVHHEGGFAGMTVNSFTSVSLRPLLVSVSLAHRTRTLDLLSRSGRFAVSILSSRQRAVALSFAAPGTDFPRRHTVLEPRGYVRVRDALAVLRCHVREVVTAGDHDIVIGEVVSFDRNAGQPLIFYEGIFGGVSADDGALEARPR